jgi:hypothetical protein
MKTFAGRQPIDLSIDGALSEVEIRWDDKKKPGTTLLTRLNREMAPIDQMTKRCRLSNNNKARATKDPLLLIS